MAARENLRILAAGDGSVLPTIITPCGSCASFLHSYPDLFGDGHPESEAAAHLAGRVLPASVFLARAGLPELLRSRGGPVARHTFHDPCHLAHYLKAGEDIRGILRSLPGDGFVEMREPDSCCGAAGSFAVTHPEHSEAVLERKMERVAQSGAALLTTACPACLIQLAGGARAHGLEVKVSHVLEVAWNSLDQSSGARAHRGD
jgi:glycolate oxidase iron-sulfur subunit